MNKRILLTTIIICALLLAPIGSGTGFAKAKKSYGTIFKLPSNRYLLQVLPSLRASQNQTRSRLKHNKALKVIEQFLVPGNVNLKTRVFKNRAALEQYLLLRYISAIPVPTEIPDPTQTAPPCNQPGSGGGSNFNGPPRIFIVLPSSGPAFMPVAIGGVNFEQCAVVYFNNAPSISLFNWSVSNIPLIGSVSVGFTIVPPAAPAGSGDVVVEYFGQRSNPFPFTVQ